MYNGCSNKAEFKGKMLTEIKKEFTIIISKRSDRALKQDR